MKRQLFSMLALAVLVVSITGAGFGETLPSDVWLLPGDIGYIDLTDSNSDVATSGWDYPDTSSKSNITVNGNCADEKNQTANEICMTLTGLAAGTYSVDAVIAGACTDESDFGIDAGFTSGSLTSYDAVGTTGRVGAYYDGNSSRNNLYRIPLGTQTVGVGGTLNVYFDDNSDGLRGLLDGVILSQSVTAPNRIITNVDRSGGASDDRDPIGVYDGEVDPLASDEFGLQLGARAASDRTFIWDYIDEELIGADYVRMFNTDKSITTSDLDYEVTIACDSFVMVLLDDEVADPQDVIDLIVSDFADSGTFVDTGWDVSHNAKSSHKPWSAYGAWLSAGTYHFGTGGEALSGESMYAIAAKVPEPSSVVMLFGVILGVLLGRRRS
jgi:hypothetical protein